MAQTAGDNTQQLSKKIMHGVSWSTAAKFFRQFIQLFFQIILARLLGPKEFGLLSMIVIFITFAEIIRGMGLGAALVQKKELPEDYCSTVFWLNIILGVVITLLFQVVSPFIAVFFNQPQLTDVLRVYSLIFFIASFNIVQDALLQRSLQFKRLFMMEAISVTCSGIIAIILAYRHAGVWTLVFQYISMSLISSVILWVTSSWKPSFRFSIAAFKDLRKFGFNLVGHDMLYVISRNIDNFLVGKYIGAEALGIYSRAYFFMLQPVNLTNQVLFRVMFPTLSALQGNISEFRKVYLKSTQIVAFLVFPVIAYVFVCSDVLIKLVLGDKWIEVAYLLRIFSIYCALDTIGITNAWIYKSLGRTDIMFRWVIYSTVIIIAAIVTGLHWGITGVAWCYSISYLVFLWLPGWYIALRLIQLPLGAMLLKLLPGFICTLITMGCLYTLYFFLQKTLPLLPLALLLFVVMATVYTFSSKFLNRDQFNMAAKLVNKAFKRNKTKHPLLNEAV